VALGVAERVSPGLSERIMASLLGPAVPPNPANGKAGLRPFDLVITNAGGLDDMEVGDGSWLWSYGTWVNGGEWATCEARQMLAYAATGRNAYSLQSMRALMGFANIFRMDSPLVRWGSEVYQPSEPVNTVFDMWAIPAALLRGLWQPVYTLDALTLTPSLPGNVTALSQAFPLLWGGKRLLLSAAGNATLGIASVSVNGAPWPAPLFTRASLTLPWSALQGADNFTIEIAYPAAAPPPAAAAAAAAAAPLRHDATRAASARALRALLPPDAALWLDAETLAAAATPDGAAVAAWPDARGGGAGPAAAQPLPAARPRFRAAAMNGRPAVLFDGAAAFLGGRLPLPAASTTLAVFADYGATSDCCTGIFFSVEGCNGMGTKAAANNASVLMIDWSGSGDTGLDDLRGRQTVAAVVYNASGAFSFADGCLESSEPPVGAAGATFMVGSRGNEMGRFFRGALSELLVFPRALNASELGAVEGYLRTKWPPPSGQPALSCGGPAPNCTLPPPLAAAAARLARFAARMRAAGFPDARYELAHALLAGGSVAAWGARCAGLADGSIAPLASRASEEAANALYVATPAKLAAGLAALLEGYAGAADAEKQRIYAAWAASAGP